MENAKYILIVDDEQDIVAVLELRLKSAGYEVITANNGKEALQRIKERLPNLIITDVLMPEMDGFVFYKELKKDKLTADIPVIILTARGKMEDAFDSVGVDDFLVKPFDAKYLTEKVERLITQSDAVHSLSQGKKVLVAGTDAEVLEMMSRQLSKMGCHVDLVSTGAQVISKTVMFLPAVIVMEVQMDGVSAAEVVQVVRKLPQAEKIPILLYSYYRITDLGTEDVRQKALTVDSAVRECMDFGATEYFGRFNENTFLKAVSKYF